MQVSSGKTTPMQAGGALMLGGEQDCYGGCTDASQAFYGLMDEVCAVVSVSLTQLHLDTTSVWQPSRHPQVLLCCGSFQACPLQDLRPSCPPHSTTPPEPPQSCYVQR